MGELLGIAEGAGVALGATGAPTGAGAEAIGDAGGGVVVIGALACGPAGIGAGASGDAGVGCAIGAGLVAMCGGCGAGVSPSN